jgi:biopolymer transport protein ExbD
MAGSSSGDGEEPVSLNVTPLIDIIFCLCIFFMCSFHFKQLQGSIDSWLPKTHGNDKTPAPLVADEIRITLRARASGTEIVFGARPVASLDELEGLVRDEWADLGSRSKRDASSVILDGEPGVPWRDVVSVLDRMKKLEIPRVEFAQPAAAGKG